MYIEPAGKVISPGPALRASPFDSSEEASFFTAGSTPFFSPVTYVNSLWVLRIRKRDV